MPPMDDFRIYEIFRRRIVEEDALINNRVSWMIWSEASLFAFWAAIDTGKVTFQFTSKTAILMLVSAIGMLIPVLGIASMAGAYSEIRNAKDRYKTNYTELYDCRKLPRITGSTFNHRFGHLFPVLVPVVFFLINLSLLLSISR